jgi:RNA polymerase sigma-70 factor (ECF subfamily)
LLGRLAGYPVARHADIEDLRQEVFLRVVRAASAYRTDGAFSTWLYRIVLNVTRDAARRRQRRICTTNDDAEPATTTTPSQQVEGQETAQLVAAALAALPGELREPLVLRHYGDLTFQQTADVLGLPTSTVKSRVVAGLQRLRSELRQYGLHQRENS